MNAAANRAEKTRTAAMRELTRCSRANSTHGRIEKLGVHFHRGASGCTPGMAPGRIVPDFVSALIEMSVQIAFEIPIDRICQVGRILRFEHAPVSSFYNLVF